MAKKTKLMAVALAAIAAASLTLTACTGSGENFGEKEKGNRTEILFCATLTKPRVRHGVN